MSSFSSTPRAASVVTALLWGLFCACSWTWCIGMFLPKIMIERFGWWGFVAFAAPNVLGCAGFGYVLRNRARSEAMVANHAGAMTGFSGVTIAYHMFFIPFLFSLVLPHFESALLYSHLAAIVVFGLGLVLCHLPDRDWLWLTALIYAGSLIVFTSIGVDPLRTISWRGTQSIEHLLWLTPTLIFGFALCPYLDLTFHRALQRSPSRHAFAVFGIAFFIMLLLTCAIWFDQRELIATAALAHILAQSVFTVGAHLREMRVSPVLTQRAHRSAAMSLPLLATPLFLIAHIFSSEGNIGEQMYLRFLVFYGLVFPAYVILFIGPARVFNLTGRNLLIFAAVTIAALPLYELGFLHRRPWLLVLPLGLFVVMALVKGQRRQAPSAGP